jgi:hypothetical protein
VICLNEVYNYIVYILNNILVIISDYVMALNGRMTDECKELGRKPGRVLIEYSLSSYNATVALLWDLAL